MQRPIRKMKVSIRYGIMYNPLRLFSISFYFDMFRKKIKVILSKIINVLLLEVRLIPA